ncbi:ABC transporter transmembrane domain-containing protein [Tateyamaria armeniaca]|uniref:ABC transporter transmembrane domain-containing protein n=1 Tax=Tateyamaria armeniaca TaxID=2518930 RepID=A0ABW8UR20_9RHOB
MDSSLFAFIWKHSKRDQLLLLALTVVTFPFLYATLELPKRIINDAIGASSNVIDLWGIELTQIQFLLALCFGYLGAVVAHGLLKMRLNTMKGVTAERLLRRFRYSLIARMLRFPRSYFRSTSQGELVSMVTSEAEPMGGLMGDMVAQPVFQAGQMLIILVFLFIQSFWFGLAGIALIPLQAWLIPMLQRRINLLNKERIKEMRAFSSEIGESAAGISDLRTNGGLRYRLAQFTDRLGRLFGIRFQIYQKKFFMKFLNNFITQLTPFFFYAVGGYLAIQGEITVGALVAALAAYKDLSSPWKELLMYYNQTQDMAVRWEVVTERFGPNGMIDEELFDGEPEEIPHLQGDIVVKDVTVRAADNNPILENIDLTIPKGARVAIQARNQTERTALAELLTREVLPTRGKIEMAGYDLSKMHQAVIAARIGYAHSRPYLFDGTLGSNLLMPLMTSPRTVDWVRDKKDRDQNEAIRSGNSGDKVDADWVDPSLAGLNNADDIRQWWFELVQAMGIDDFMFRRMLTSRIDPDMHPELAKAIVAMRPAVEECLREKELIDEVYRFDPEAFNPAVPLGGNLLFASPKREISQEGLAANTVFMNLIFEHGLAEQGIAISQTLIETLHQTFGRDGTSHPLFTALNIDDALYERLVDISQRRRERGDIALTDDEFALLLTVPFAFTAEQIGPAFPESFKKEIVEIRKASGVALRTQTEDFFVPIDPENYLPRLTLLENALYGRISMVAGLKGELIEDLVADLIKDEGLRRLVAETAFDIPTGLGGTNLPAVFHERAAFSRAGIKRPDVLVLDRALASHSAEERRKTRNALRGLLPDATLIFLEEKFENPDAYDLFVEIKDGRIDGVQKNDEEEGDDLSRKLRVIARTELFAGLSNRNQRLLAFAANWYEAKKDQRIFSMNEKPDAAYLCISGSAVMTYNTDEGERPVTTVEPGRLIGDLAIISNEPRQLNLTATTKSTFLRIGATEFRAVVENDSTVLLSLLQTVAGHLTGAAELLRQANIAIPQDEGPPPPPLDE